MKTKAMVVISFILIILDQLTKYNAFLNSEELYIINYGIIFGLYEPTKFIMVLILILGVATGIVAFLFYRAYISSCRQGILMDIFVILWMSSIISNTIDRIIFGGGRDFIDALGFYMNMADIYMYIGAIALVVELVLNRRCDVKFFNFPKLMVQDVKCIWSRIR